MFSDHFRLWNMPFWSVLPKKKANINCLLWVQRTLNFPCLGKIRLSSHNWLTCWSCPLSHFNLSSASHELQRNFTHIDRMTLTSGVFVSAGQANLNMKNISYFLSPSAKAQKIVYKNKQKNNIYMYRENK